jgi:hypothetical protein
MDATGDTGKATVPERATAPEAEGAAAPYPASNHPFGPDGAAILATEHWSLLASRSLIWNEAQSRATVFLSVLSAATIALALLADATGFGPQTTTLALVLLPVVLFLGIAAHGRLVEINREEVELSLAMNRLRHAYLKIAPALEPYFTTGHHDDEQGLAASYLAGGHRLRRWGQFLVNTPTIVATVDAALAAAIVVLVVRAAEAATTVAVVSGAVTFLVVWAALSCCNAAPWTRCAVRRRGSPRRQTKPERPAGSSAPLQQMTGGSRYWPTRSRIFDQVRSGRDLALVLSPGLEPEGTPDRTDGLSADPHVHHWLLLSRRLPLQNQLQTTKCLFQENSSTDQPDRTLGVCQPRQQAAPRPAAANGLGPPRRPVEHRQADDAVAGGAAIAKGRYRRRDSDPLR